MNVIPFEPRKENRKRSSDIQVKQDLYEQLLEIEENIESLEIKAARKEKWLRSGLLKYQKELYDRYMTELEQLRKERIIAEKNRKDVIMRLMKEKEGRG